MANRLLCVFAHPDDEVFCAGGTIARCVSEGWEVMVVSATPGDAGQIRDAGIATRRTLGKVREAELRESCRRLGAQHAVCLTYGDGTLKDVDLCELAGQLVRIVRDFRPDVVISFGPDGAYGHPDHVAISQATTHACQLAGDAAQYAEQVAGGLTPFSPARLYYSYFPRSRMLMLEALARWLVSRQSHSGATGQVDPVEFARALLLFSEEATMLSYSSDRIDVNWYPSGFFIIEQGEVAKDLYLILSGHAQAVVEREDGTLDVVNELGPGQFFGELALVRRHRRLAHVIARDNVTCLVMSMSEAILFAGRGEGAAISGGADRGDSSEPSREAVDTGAATHCLDVSAFVARKVGAMSAHRSQYPITPEMFPLDMLEDMMGKEYFVQALPRPTLGDTLLPAASGQTL